MKKSVILTFAAICFLTLGCTKEQNSHLIKPEISKDFITDTLVIQLLEINAQLMNKMSFSFEAVKPLFRKPFVSNQEKKEISDALGFKNEKEYDFFMKIQFELIQKIKAKYPAIVKSPSIDTLLYTASQKSRKSTIKAFRFDNKCGDRLKNCLALGNSVYTAEILGCTAGAIGIGSVTLGIGGIIFQIACGAAALEHLSIMRTGCQLDYNDCH